MQMGTRSIHARRRANSSSTAGGGGLLGIARPQVRVSKATKTAVSDRPRWLHAPLRDKLANAASYHFRPWHGPERRARDQAQAVSRSGHHVAASSARRVV